MVKLSRTRYYEKSKLEITSIVNFMGMRWEILKSSLNFAYNTRDPIGTIEVYEKDKIRKIRPYLELLCIHFDNIHMAEYLSIDK